MWPLTATRRSVSSAALASRNDSAAVLLLATTSASDTVSRRRRSRELALSYATSTTAAMTSEAALVRTPMAVSRRASDRRPIHARSVVRMASGVNGTALVLHDSGEAEELRAQADPVALRRLEV